MRLAVSGIAGAGVASMRAVTVVPHEVVPSEFRFRWRLRLSVVSPGRSGALHRAFASNAHRPATEVVTSIVSVGCASCLSAGSHELQGA
jgi:hypothetical protein